MFIKQELAHQSEQRAKALNIDSIISRLEKPITAFEASRRRINRAILPVEDVRAARVPRVPPTTPTSIEKRRANLSFAGAVPSNKELERLLNGDDLVDEFYLHRALVAAKPVSRLLVCNEAGRELGYATGFMIAPEILLTNWHVFGSPEDAAFSISEFEYTRDIRGLDVSSYKFRLRPDLFFHSDKQLDYALVAVNSVSLDGSADLRTFGYHRLIQDPNKVREGEWVTIIQHPGGSRRQFAIRDNLVIQKQPGDKFMWYQSDTAQGSSGAPAFNDSFQVVALHHLGRARKEGDMYVLRDGRKVQSLEGVEETDVDWVANEGLRVSVLCGAITEGLKGVRNSYIEQLFAAMNEEGDIMSNTLQGRTTPVAPQQAQRNNGVFATPHVTVGASGIIIPLQLQVTLSYDSQTHVTSTPASASRPSPNLAPLSNESAEFEKLAQPIIDSNYKSRRGYQKDFIGVEVPLPTVSDKTKVAKLENGGYVIPYEHFSVVIHKHRRLALFTASNVHGAQKVREPEPGRNYSRKALSGLKKGDTEKWKTDPRIRGEHQLPDRFFTKDRQAFDKGHIVRREDVCWGKDYEQIRRANGDTYHTTNCSPQVAGFNQADVGGEWGQLEDIVFGQATTKQEKYSILAGPVLADDDPEFEGVDDWGPVNVQIPRKFWKIVITQADGALQTYAFILEQNLETVKFEEEFFVDQTWRKRMIRIEDLEKMLGIIEFPQAIKNADQAGTENGEELLRRAKGGLLHPTVATVS